MTISTSNKFKIWLDKSKIHDTKFREWADLKIESLYKYIKASDVIPVTGWNLARKFGCNLAHTPVDTFGVKEIHKYINLVNVQTVDIETIEHMPKIQPP